MCFPNQFLIKNLLRQCVFPFPGKWEFYEKGVDFCKYGLIYNLKTAKWPEDPLNNFWSKISIKLTQQLLRSQSFRRSGATRHLAIKTGQVTLSHFKTFTFFFKYNYIAHVVSNFHTHATIINEVINEISNKKINKIPCCILN